MKSKINFILNWSDVVYPERNNIVFENRNKTYGAFAIRILYERNLIFSLLFSVFIFGGLLGLQALLKHPIETLINLIEEKRTEILLIESHFINTDIKIYP